MASTGTRVYSSDYNAVQVKVRTVLGDGYPYGVNTVYSEYGYGATLLSNPVTNIREYNTSTIASNVTAGSYTLTLTSVVGVKIGKIVNTTGTVTGSIITAVNSTNNAITINNSTTSIVYSGNQISTYYNSSVLITKKQWQDLEDDINTINKHQFNTNFAGYGTISGKVTLANLSSLNSVIDNLTLSRNTVHPSQLTLDPYLVEKTVPYQWGGPGNKGIQSLATVQFNSTNEMQYFFNSGGELLFGGQGPTTLLTAQDTAWYNLLNNVFLYTSARFTRTEFIRIGDVPITWYQVSDGNPPYAINTISISAQKFSNYILFAVVFQDAHVPIGGSPFDLVSSLAGYKVYQKRATGAFTGAQTVSVSLNNFTVV